MFERLHGLYGGGICHGGRAAGIPGRHAVERGGEGGGAEGVTRGGGWDPVAAPGGLGQESVTSRAPKIPILMLPRKAGPR